MVNIGPVLLCFYLLFIVDLLILFLRVDLRVGECILVTVRATIFSILELIPKTKVKCC